MHLYRTEKGAVLDHNGMLCGISVEWDYLVNRVGLRDFLEDLVLREVYEPLTVIPAILAPIGKQEVWAAGVTYERSRVARMEEAEDAGGGDFYDRVYVADRPEIFFKAPYYRTVDPGQSVKIRRDSIWNVPEPEVTLLISSARTIEGYTIGNDVSSRSIEGENPLYLPQAKSYDGSCALGPAIWLPQKPIPLNSRIKLDIQRGESTVFEGETSLERMKRSFDDLVAYLFHACTFPYGCFLMTGTGIVPPDSFSLLEGDVVHIHVDGIGTLSNPVEWIGKS